MITPSLTDQYFLWPSQPVRSLPLNISTTSRLPSRGPTTGAPSFLSSANATDRTSSAATANLSMTHLQARGETATEPVYSGSGRRGSSAKTPKPQEGSRQVKDKKAVLLADRFF